MSAFAGVPAEKPLVWTSRVDGNGYRLCVPVLNWTLRAGRLLAPLKQSVLQKRSSIFREGAGDLTHQKPPRPPFFAVFRGKVPLFSRFCLFFVRIAAIFSGLESAGFAAWNVSIRQVWLVIQTLLRDGRIA